MPQPVSSGHLHTLDALRGLAAIAVMLFHISGDAFQNMFGQRPAGDAFAAGYSGLDMFFVLSGFIILHVHRADLGRPWQVLSYLRRRLARIYPPYWAITLAYAGIFLATGQELDPYRLVSSLLLLPGQPPLLSIAWTLSHEMLFYLLFALAILWPRAGLAAGLGWVAASLAVPAGQGWLADFLFDLRHVEFLIGAIAALAVRHGAVARPLPVALGGALLFGLSAVLDTAQAGFTPQAHILAYGLGSGLIIAGLATAEQAGRLRVPTPLRCLGEASYTLYLTHLSAYSLLARLARMAHLPEILPGWALLGLLAVAITALALLLYHTLEKPLLRLCRPARPLLVAARPA
ncbi:acyltransferase [Roseomonas sp. GC11]|uniref:acyltransferase family protein n=1 Tax=Roseomonas sp. GC11 TaxID=2950546 RepID=UPI00210C927A|nr:acyltransferase [Roseomonas sp. GC11]MCQ4161255.1 acyltransferase [Roseomonas sp. GC11]